MRVALGIEYNGVQFCGWQTQPSGCACRTTSNSALSHIAGEPIETVCAGRAPTPAFMHTVRSFISKPRAASGIGLGARRQCVADGRSLRALGAPSRDDFHARYSALSRHYRYVLLNHAVRPALGHGRIGWFHLALDVVRMREAAALLVGEHDFSAFRSSECQARSPIRRLSRLDIATARRLCDIRFRCECICTTWCATRVGACSGRKRSS